MCGYNFNSYVYGQLAIVLKCFMKCDKITGMSENEYYGFINPSSEL